MFTTQTVMTDRGNNTETRTIRTQAVIDRVRERRGRAGAAAASGAVTSGSGGPAAGVTSSGDTQPPEDWVAGRRTMRWRRTTVNVDLLCE